MSMTVPPSAAQDARGIQMFARYAYAPNALGYCGPPPGAGFPEGSLAQVAEAAPKFSGVWPYLRVLSAMTGIADPLDYRLVESYWLGGGIGAGLDPNEFVDALLTIIGPRAGQCWSHLTTDLADEAAPNHIFHVLGVYPWSRLLGKGMDEEPLRVLDNCRITWATVLSRSRNEIEVSCRGLTFSDGELGLAEPSLRRLQVRVDGYSAVPDVDSGDEVAVHWGRLCDRLQPEQVQALTDSTHRQLRVTNQRLARS